jgi:hypothetical protein
VFQLLYILSTTLFYRRIVNDSRYNSLRASWLNIFEVQNAEYRKCTHFPPAQLLKMILLEMRLLLLLERRRRSRRRRPVAMTDRQQLLLLLQRP